MLISTDMLVLDDLFLIICSGIYSVFGMDDLQQQVEENMKKRKHAPKKLSASCVRENFCRVELLPSLKATVPALKLLVEKASALAVPLVLPLPVTVSLPCRFSRSF